MDADKELSKFINHCNEVKAAAFRHQIRGNMSIIKSQPDSEPSTKK